ncbi:hypothetical protein ACTRXD_01990 [Nitrospira sp. T9]|uniref:hypothetical protein n=1 Tax=unclassified Nitrospira TaxID=2652172 RepID=UPI003F97DD37
MKKILLIGALVLAGVSVAYCQHFWFPHTWHQKMTLEVEADGQRYTGSSVVEVSWRKNDPIGAANGPEWIGGIRGEAPYLEVPGHGVLFGLISFAGNSSYAADLATQVITDWKGWARGPQEFSLAKTAEGQTLTIPHDRYPLLVTFSDITDPKTVQQVDSTNLAATFGPGVSLKRITLEITDEPMTEGKIEQVLGWLGPHPEPTLGHSKDIFNPIFAATVHHGDFIRR